MNKEIDIQTIEEGCSLLKEASNILVDLDKDVFRMRDYLSKDCLLLKDLSLEENIELCRGHLQNTSSCLDDYIEDLLVAIKQTSDGGE